MAFRGFTYRLYPTGEQNSRLTQIAGVCRLVWNLCLEQRLTWHRHYRRASGRSLDWVTQSRELTLLRKEVDWVRDCPQEACQRTIADLHAAFANMRRLGNGAPKFKAKGISDSISFPARSIPVQKLNDKWAQVRVPKVGWIKYRVSRPLRGKLCEATIRLRGDVWHISFGCETEDDTQNGVGLIGIDRGVTIPLALSDGTKYLLPKSLRQLERRRKKLERRLSRKVSSSNRRLKAKTAVSKAYAKAARIREHWAHVSTSDITRRFGTVVIEDLHTRNMTAKGRGKRGLNRSILNVGWHLLERMLSYKADRLIKVPAAYSSQTCAMCGMVDRQSRKSQAAFACTSCGHQDNADRNAAIVILQRGNTALLGVEGCGCAPREAPTAKLATAA